MPAAPPPTPVGGGLPPGRVPQGKRTLRRTSAGSGRVCRGGCQRQRAARLPASSPARSPNFRFSVPGCLGLASAGLTSPPPLLPAPEQFQEFAQSQDQFQPPHKLQPRQLQLHRKQLVAAWPWSPRGTGEALSLGADLVTGGASAPDGWTGPPARRRQRKEGPPASARSPQVPQLPLRSVQKRPSSRVDWLCLCRIWQ